MAAVGYTKFSGALDRKRCDRGAWRGVMTLSTNFENSRSVSLFGDDFGEDVRAGGLVPSGREDL
jgi:hypothetical protein